MDSPSLAFFIANLERINALAEASPGFICRLTDDSESAVVPRPFGDNFFVNMSMWVDVESLSNYAFKSEHVEIMRRRREWFECLSEAFAVLWWVPKDHRPSTTEAKERLGHLQTFGATSHAFTFKEPFPAPDAPCTPSEFTSNDAHSTSRLT
jgi:hypothetical protein